MWFNYVLHRMLNFPEFSHCVVQLYSSQDVKFPMSLDVFDLCSESLQQKLIPARDKFKEQEDKFAEEQTKVSHNC